MIQPPTPKVPGFVGDGLTIACHTGFVGDGRTIACHTAIAQIVMLFCWMGVISHSPHFTTRNHGSSQILEEVQLGRLLSTKEVQLGRQGSSQPRKCSPTTPPLEYWKKCISDGPSHPRKCSPDNKAPPKSRKKSSPDHYKPPLPTHPDHDHCSTPVSMT